MSELSVLGRALLAAASYEKPGSIADVGPISGWRAISESVMAQALFDDPNADKIPFSDLWGDGLFVQAYEKGGPQGSNEIVISFRGTDSFEDFLTQNVSLGIPGVGEQLLFAYFFVEAVKAFAASSEPPKTITFTGHSLGGSLASIFAIRENTEAVVFSPALSRSELIDMLDGFDKILNSAAVNFDPATLPEGLAIFTDAPANPGMGIPQPRVRITIPSLVDTENAEAFIAAREGNIKVIRVEGEILGAIGVGADVAVGQQTVLGVGDFELQQTLNPLFASLWDFLSATFTDEAVALHSIDLHVFLTAIGDIDTGALPLLDIASSVSAFLPALFNEELVGNTDPNDEGEPTFIREVVRQHLAAIDGGAVDTILTGLQSDLVKLFTNIPMLPALAQESENLQSALTLAAIAHAKENLTTLADTDGLFDNDFGNDFLELVPLIGEAALILLRATEPAVDVVKELFDATLSAISEFPDVTRADVLSALMGAGFQALDDDPAVTAEVFAYFETLTEESLTLLGMEPVGEGFAFPELIKALGVTLVDTLEIIQRTGLTAPGVVRDFAAGIIGGLAEIDLWGPKENLSNKDLERLDARWIFQNGAMASANILKAIFVESGVLIAHPKTAEDGDDEIPEGTPINIDVELVRSLHNGVVQEAFAAAGIKRAVIGFTPTDDVSFGRNLADTLDFFAEKSGFPGEDIGAVPLDPLWLEVEINGFGQGDENFWNNPVLDIYRIGFIVSGFPEEPVPIRLILEPGSIYVGNGNTIISAPRVYFGNNPDAWQDVLDFYVENGIPRDQLGPTAPQVGSDQDDVLGGDENDNTQYGKDGNDQIDGLSGSDYQDGGKGNDIINGGWGPDISRGGAGNDIINGGGDSDIVKGDGGDDILRGDVGDDSIEGGTGNDELFGDEGFDTLVGGRGDDLLTGGADDDSLDGGTGFDVAHFSGLSTDYLVTEFNGQFIVRDLRSGVDGTDTLSNVEAIEFGDGAELLIASGNEITLDEDQEHTGLLVTSGQLSGPLNFILANNPANGNIVLDNDTGAFTYTPDQDFNGADSFVVDISDGFGGTDQVTVSVTVDPVNDAPIAADQGLTTDLDMAVQGTVAATDVDNDPLFFGLSLAPTNGELILDNDTGAFTYTPNASFIGTDSFDIVVDDGNGGLDFATISVDVQNAQTGPITITGTEGADIIDVSSSSVDHIINALGGDDTILSGGGSDTINGGSGVDFIEAGAGADIISGGTGTDTLSFAGSFAGVSLQRSYTIIEIRIQFGQIIEFEHTFDFGTGFAGEAVATGGDAEGDTVSIDIENITGSEFDDSLGATSFGGIIAGLGGDDVLAGSAGVDILRGGDGADQIFGGSDDDTLEGESGNDTLRGEKGHDTYIFGLNSGDDLIDNKDKSLNNDLILFEDGIENNNLWFSRIGDDLLIDVLVGDGSVTIKDWFKPPLLNPFPFFSVIEAYAVKTIQTGAHALDEAQVAALVDAMALVPKPATDEIDLTDPVYASLVPIFQNAWQAGSNGNTQSSSQLLPVDFGFSGFAAGEFNTGFDKPFSISPTRSGGPSFLEGAVSSKQAIFKDILSTQVDFVRQGDDLKINIDIDGSKGEFLVEDWYTGKEFNSIEFADTTFTSTEIEALVKAEVVSAAATLQAPSETPAFSFGAMIPGIDGRRGEFVADPDFNHFENFQRPEGAFAGIPTLLDQNDTAEVSAGESAKTFVGQEFGTFVNHGGIPDRKLTRGDFELSEQLLLDRILHDRDFGLVAGSQASTIDLSGESGGSDAPDIGADADEAANLQRLVQAMAAFNPNSSGELDRKDFTQRPDTTFIATPTEF